MQLFKPFNYIKTISKKKLFYVLAAAALCFAGILFWKAHSQPAAAVETIPMVRTAVVDAAGGLKSYTYAGEVRGRYESQLAFQVTGKIIKRNVQLGSVVNAGDILLEIDPKDLQQAVNSSSAQVHSAESQLKLTESNLQRYRQLYAQSAISRAQLDQYENAYEMAQAAVQEASAQYGQSSNQLDYSLLYANKSGVISSISAEVGQVVSAGQTVLTIVQSGEREVEISVPENRIEELHKAAQFTVSFWALPDLKVNGKVREISPTAAPATRTYQVRISLLNPPPQIKLGMTAAVTLSSASDQNTNLISIPLSAIYQTSDTPGVWVVTDHTVNLRPIQVGSLGNDQVQVTGLRPGEIIVTSGVHKLHEGQKVGIPDGGRQ
ncbi:efflux RND transporter periplasmic adaptor subunit [Pelosinus fermentans]|uniref:Efflux transporter, RND family, MFP subunit n=1 Tax=Pelosinus fermentans JBW45 TaxID=1192197 RepID=I9NPC6_9FIRM|nr:efflux RND transporter periplasmic adaptor subunit [Pelosinus fermentans]AJQ26167.1 efflux transporter, RND family, MFP subunit [Pelosinus fermentans JBW45]